MLILTRKLGEGIIIGADVVVRVIEVKGGQVKLGIDAPQKTTVHREEVYRRICEENVRAATHVPTRLDGVVRALNARRERDDGGGAPA
ncbi:MAG: carbon storage regulator CsrA [Nitrospirae bacterium]|nr:carbon storage regulator CsrA [Nitrospirota bacterium]